MNAERCRKILGFSNMDTNSVYQWNDNLYDSKRWTNNEISVILKTINNDVDYDDDTLHFAGAGKQ